MKHSAALYSLLLIVTVKSFNVGIIAPIFSSFNVIIFKSFSILIWSSILLPSFPQVIIMKSNWKNVLE